jgi:hypothetical protein
MMAKKMILMVGIFCVLGGTRMRGMIRVKDKTSEGKIHLGAVLTAMTNKICSFPDEDDSCDSIVPCDSVRPCFGMIAHMTGQKAFGGMLASTLPMCKKYFCEEYPGLDGFVEKAHVRIQLAIKKMEEEGGNVPNSFLCNALIRQTGERFFHVPEETKLSDDAYYLKIKKDCLKDLWEKEAPCKSQSDFLVKRLRFFDVTVIKLIVLSSQQTGLVGGCPMPNVVQLRKYLLYAREEQKEETQKTEDLKAETKKGWSCAIL